MSGIKRSANRPKIAKHLRNTREKAFVNRTKEERDREHALTDSWAEKQRLLEPERVEEAKAETRRKRREARMAAREKDFYS